MEAHQGKQIFAIQLLSLIGREGEIHVSVHSEAPDQSQWTVVI
jgi:hypothetical protein